MFSHIFSIKRRSKEEQADKKGKYEHLGPTPNGWYLHKGWSSNGENTMCVKIGLDWMDDH